MIDKNQFIAYSLLMSSMARQSDEYAHGMQRVYFLQFKINTLEYHYTGCYKNIDNNAVTVSQKIIANGLNKLSISAWCRFIVQC